MCSACRSAAGDDDLQHDGRHVEGQPEQARAADVGPPLGLLRRREVGGDLVAESVLRTTEVLGDERGDDGERCGDLQRREEVGDGIGHAHTPEDLPVARRVRAHELEVRGLHLTQATGDVDEDDEVHHQRDHQPARHLTGDREHVVEHCDEHEDRHRVQRDRQRGDDLVEQLEPQQHERHQHTQRGPDEQTDEGVPAGHPHRGPDQIDVVDEAAEDLRGRDEEVGLDVERRHGRLPHTEEQRAEHQRWQHHLGGGAEGVQRGSLAHRSSMPRAPPVISTPRSASRTAVIRP
ncbi:unannotated protein [freshwater metagenome]|uniref:Unannotated protein n=1 Tax=freshwater metagenome TaxID=449393 RepID=A0A6J6FRS4_9ZZZZ